MTTEYYNRSHHQERWVRAISQAYKGITQVFEPTVWLHRDPEAEEKMLRSPTIAHAVQQRQAYVAGRSWMLLPKTDGPAGKLAAKVGTELIEYIKHFTEARSLLARAFFHGARFARIHGEPRTLTLGDGKPRVWWVPVSLEDLDKRAYRIKSDVHDTGEAKAHWERRDFVHDEWVPESRYEALRTVKHTFNDDMNSLGYGRPLREVLGWAWYAEAEILQAALVSCERHAGGTVVMKVDGFRSGGNDHTNEKAFTAYLNAVKKMRSQHTIILDKTDDYEIVPANGEGHQVYDLMLRNLKNQIYTCVLGANLTTSADEGGSYALGRVQENSTEMLIQFDRDALGETLTDDLVGAVWHYNRPNLVELGIADEHPVFSIAQEKREDPTIAAQNAATLNQMGVPLASEDVYEKTGFRQPEEGEEVIAGAVATPPLPGFNFD